MRGHSNVKAFANSASRQNAPLPSPLLTGSTMVVAAAIAASTALPPLNNMANPACAASGCDVDTTLRANSGMRVDV